MSQLTVSIQRAFQNTSYNATEGSLLLCFALGTSLAYKLQLPTSPVMSLSEYYHQHHSAIVNDIVSEINEAYPINPVLAVDFVKKSFELRYKLVFDPTNEQSLDVMGVVMGSSNDCLPPQVKDLHLRNRDNPGMETLRDLFWRFDKAFRDRLVTEAPASVR